VVAVAQPGHAWLAGQIVRAWGNDDFARPAPLEEVCLGAEQHDIAWLAWEAAPTLNPATGLPHRFHEVPLADRLRDWGRGVRLALAAYGRYPALLVSLHADTIYAPLLDAGGLDGDDLALVRVFLGEQHAFQRAACEALACDRRHAGHVGSEALERNRLLVAAADGLSLAVCGGVTGEVRRRACRGPGRSASRCAWARRAGTRRTWSWSRGRSGPGGSSWSARGAGCAAGSRTRPRCARPSTRLSGSRSPPRCDPADRATMRASPKPCEVDLRCGW
jgi:hypothetical protein